MLQFGAGLLSATFVGIDERLRTKRPFFIILLTLDTDFFLQELQCLFN